MQRVEKGAQLNEGSLYPHDLLSLRGRTDAEQYFVAEVQEVYKKQGVDINDKHIELIVRQMMKKVRVDQRGDSGYLPGQLVDRNDFLVRNEEVKKAKGDTAEYEEVILGITKASLNTDSFLSAASFQETTKVLTDAALEGKKDGLAGLKENVIIGKLIPAATGLKRYRRIEIEPSEPLPRADDVALLDSDELVAELGLAEDDFGSGLGTAFEQDLSEPRGDRRRRRRRRRDGLRRGARRARHRAARRRVRRSPRARKGAGGRPRAPVLRQGRLTPSARPVLQLRHVRGGEPGLRVGLDQQRRAAAPARPVAARVVQRIVDPRDRRIGAGVELDRAELPVGVAARPGRGRSSGRAAARRSPSAWGRYSLAFSSQPLHQTRSKSRWQRRAGARPRWAKGDAAHRRPGARSRVDVRPSRNRTARARRRCPSGAVVCRDFARFARDRVPERPQRGTLRIADRSITTERTPMTGRVVGIGSEVGSAPPYA